MPNIILTKADIRAIQKIIRNGTAKLVRSKRRRKRKSRQRKKK